MFISVHLVLSFLLTVFVFFLLIAFFLFIVLFFSFLLFVLKVRMSPLFSKRYLT